ncbi:Pyrrolo-quinoline quinone [Planctomycetales bacterium 10988]|nr:Pyrrolo-quinoline quinone [Planctomycetales bacterium 10988]
MNQSSRFWPWGGLTLIVLGVLGSAIYLTHVQADTDGAQETVRTGDWSMWGGDNSRNMVSKAKNVDFSFVPPTDYDDPKNVLWTAKLGSQTYGNPTVASGKVLVGTNNGNEYRPHHEGDRGVVLCFDEKNGDLLWQLTREKLEAGRVNDWPEQGICSTPCVEGNRVYVITNRCEFMCLDLEGFHDGENDGPYKDEVDTEELDADIIWSLDMIEEFGVFPHNLATSSPLIYEEMVYGLTSNGVDEAHLEVPSPRSPCFVALNKMTGELVWYDNTPADKILHGQWSSPALGVVNGKAQVYFPGGDGWLYALDAKTGDHIWQFDLNPKDSVWVLGGRGTRNAIISTPVFYDNSVILGVGQDPEHGEGVGHLYRIDATKTDDVTESGKIWHYGDVDEDGEMIYRRTISTVAVTDGLVFAADLSGFLHCIDFETGERYWEGDLLAAVWGSPMVIDGRVLIGDEDGELAMFEVSKEENVIEELLFNSSIYSTPTLANGKLFVTDRSQLYCFEVQP